MGIATQFPHCNYTVGPYGSGPTATYFSIYLYIIVASEYTVLFIIMIIIQVHGLKYYILLTEHMVVLGIARRGSE